MGKTGIISVIPKNFDHAFPTMEKSLREKGLSMFPGTFKMYFPYKEMSGKRRTGLDPDAAYIDNIKDPELRSTEKARVKALKDKLEKETQLDLSPNSKYWDTIYPAKLSDGDNIFDLSNPEKAITFAWLRVHPTIARSLEAYMAGEYLPDTHFYVKDTDIEVQLAYNKTKAINDAIGKMESFTVDKRRKVARLLGLPIVEDTKPEVVYTELDTFIRTPVVKTGPYKGQDSLNVFKDISGLNDNHIYVRDLVNQALAKNIYREGKAGVITEGDAVRFKNREEMYKHYLDEDHQQDLFELEQRIKVKELV